MTADLLDALRAAEASVLQAAVELVREYDNPVPDGAMRKILRDNLSAKVRAWEELDRRSALRAPVGPPA